LPDTPITPGMDGIAAPAPPARSPGLHPYARVAIYLLGYFVFALVVSVGGAIVLGMLAGTGIVRLPEISPALAQMGIEKIIEFLSPYLLPLVLFLTLYTIGYTWAFMRIVERRPLRSLGLSWRRGSPSDFVKGIGLAVLVLGMVFAFSLATGAIRVLGFARPASPTGSVVGYLAGALVAFLSVGLYEEVMFRGYVLQTLSERSGRFVAILVSSIIFALLHGANPGADAFGMLNTTAIAFILSVLYFRTQSLWMPIGFHFAWNFSLGYVYSLPVSGIPLHGILNVVEVDRASRVTGGSYGPEAGLACTIALAAWGAWLIWKRTGRRAPV
jgi:membrane protease YdiL (CAAX protease family)